MTNIWLFYTLQLVFFTTNLMIINTCQDIDRTEGHKKSPHKSFQLFQTNPLALEKMQQNGFNQKVLKLLNT